MTTHSAYQDVFVLSSCVINWLLLTNTVRATRSFDARRPSVRFLDYNFTHATELTATRAVAVMR